MHPIPYHPDNPPLRRVVLVGGGHTHVQVLRNFAMLGLPENVELTVVLDQPVAIYSGMVPGLIAGQYAEEELEIDVAPLARRAKARLVLAACTGVDPARRSIRLHGRPPIPYEVASFDIGSTVAHLDLPGVREHAVPTRPISALVQRFADLEEQHRERAPDAGDARPRKIVVVGAGAGGVEVAFCAGEHFRRQDRCAPEVTVVHGAPNPLPGALPRLSQRVRQRGAERGIVWRDNTRAAGVHPPGNNSQVALELEGGECVAADHVFWVTGAHPHTVLEDLPSDHRGFVRTRPTLQVDGFDDLFAVGDCATISETPNPKAGVYAVRQGPFLISNLRRLLNDRPLRIYKPQSDFLTLLNLGDGTAIGARSGLVFEGRWVQRMKDRIDRKFMDRFQVLNRDGSLRPGHEMKTESEPMACGGCAAKVEQNALQSALDRLISTRGSVAEGAQQRGNLTLGSRDDIATYRLPEISESSAAADSLVAKSTIVSPTLALNVDGFRAFTDDPWLVGRTAAVNAMSDLEVKGSRALCAQAFVTVPVSLSPEHAAEVLFQVLDGAREAFDFAGAELVGGHSMTGPELAVGFAVDGLFCGGLAPKQGPVEPGDRLILTKPLGTGVLLHADMMGRARGSWLEALHAQLVTSNGPSAHLAYRTAQARSELRATTDVTGFGLAGHLLEMLAAPPSGVGLDLSLSALPLLDGAVDLLKQGLRSTAHPLNSARGLQFDAAPELRSQPQFDILFDPQTSGGMLLAASAESSQTLLNALQQGPAPQATIIGEFVRRQASQHVCRVVA